jgi:CDP-glucose 4,6-dehydratase
MESVEIKVMFQNVFFNKKILITGDTGFKGSWLAIWLNQLGAEVYGYALPPKNNYDNFVVCNLDKKINHLDGDIRDLEKLKNYFNTVKPDFAFHLAAQPLVLESYKNPHYTFETNILGTVNFFEAVRNTPSVKAALNITSDKCYQNNEWVWGYRENDPMGGNDPYSASKGCSELVTNSYINSFFKINSHCAIASARAGNVIGGGDWAEDRIVPDFFRSILNQDKMIVRNPDAIRPWQHVLEPLSGYLLLASKLFLNANKFSGGWNFGPTDTSTYKVSELINSIIRFLGKGDVVFSDNPEKPHEANMLKLDISKSNFNLNWKPILNFDQLIEFTVNGYVAQVANDNLIDERIKQIDTYCKIAKLNNCSWID